MTPDLVSALQTEVEGAVRRLKGMSESEAEIAAKSGGWTVKQVLGHLIDSSVNNHYRIVRAVIDRGYRDPGYDGDGWVAANRYDLSHDDGRLVQPQAMTAEVKLPRRMRKDVRCFAHLAYTTLLLLFMASFPLAAAEPPAVRAVVTRDKDRKPAPMFQLRDSSGNSVKLADYRGKVLLLNFWATWCGGCNKEIPWFQEFATKFGPRKFSVLGVSVDEDGWAAVKPYLKNANVTCRMTLAEPSTTDDYAVKSMPATFIIDRKGRIAATYVGLVDRTDVEANLTNLLGRR